MSDATAAKPASLWRHRDFLKLWTGQTISVFGSAVTDLALPLVAVTVLNASPADMGVLGALGTLPFLLIGLFAGVWVDRLRRRPLLIAADVARALLIGAVPVAWALGGLRMPVLYVVAFLAGVARVFFDVSYQAFLPALVSRAKLVEGNSKMEISFAAAGIAGPGLAGALIRLFTAPVAMAADAFSFLVSAVSLLMIRTPEPEPMSTGARRNMWREIREGLHVVFGNRVLWSIAGCTGTSNFFSSMWGAVYVLYLTRNLGITAEVMGLIFAAAAPGALVGALISARVAGRLGLGPTIIAASALGALGAWLVPLAAGPLPVVAGILIVSGFTMGIANVVYNVNQVSLRQAITPDRLLGRMNASMRFLVWGTLPLGALAGGALSTFLGVHQAIAIGAAGQLLACAWVFFSPVRHLRTQPQPVAE